MLKRRQWFIIAAIVVFIGLYIFVIYKFADPPGLPIPSANNPADRATSSS